MSEATTMETAKTQTEAATSQATTETATTLLTAADSTKEQATSEQKQSAETKTEAATTEQKAETKTEEKKTEGAPEKYEFKDADKFDATVLGSFSEAAKAANLPQDVAQKILETVAPKLAERQTEQVKAVQQGWVEASTADKEFGGEKLKENLSIAVKARDQFATPELRTFLEDTRLGDHPEVIRLFYRIGKAISEDKIVSGSAVTTETDPAKRLFPNQA